jgi:biopolymer transport protein ExbB
MDVMEKGGWVMIPLAILLLSAFYVTIERYLAIQKIGHVDKNFQQHIMHMVSSGNISGAKQACATHPSLYARIVEKGLLRLGSPIHEIESGIENAARGSISELEKNMSLLSAVAMMAPMFGFLGTVLGMIRIFSDIAVSDNLSIGIIAGGMYEKMITSGAGLFVGIVAHICYVVINNMIDRKIVELESASSEFVDLLYQPKL